MKGFIIKFRRMLPRRLTIPLLAALTGMFLVLAYTARYGSLATADSIRYLSVARHLLDGLGWEGFDGENYVHWPPLLPVVLVAAGLLGVDPFAAIRFLNAGVFGGILFFSVWWILKNTEDIFLRFAGTLLFLFSVPLFLISIYAWSEPLFILFSLLSFLALAKEREKEGSAALLSLSLFFSMLAGLTRYIGVVVFLTAALFLLWDHRYSLKRRTMRALLYLFFSILPLFLWFLRNWFIDETLTGNRAGSSAGFFENTGRVFWVIGEWFAGGEASRAIQGLVVVLLIAGGLFLARIDREHKEGVPAFLKISILFSGLYTGGLIFLSSVVLFDPIDKRLLSPVFVPLVLSAVFALDHVFCLEREGVRSRILRYSAEAGVSAVVVLSMFYILSDVYNTALKTEPLFSRDWKRSEIVPYVETMPVKESFWSNFPDQINLLTGRAARLSPLKMVPEGHPRQPVDYLNDLRKEAADGAPVFLVWFNDPSRDFCLYSIEELRAFFEITTEGTFIDGTIYRIRTVEEK